jgi:hypothetical protein
MGVCSWGTCDFTNGSSTPPGEVYCTSTSELFRPPGSKSCSARCGGGHQFQEHTRYDALTEGSLTTYFTRQNLTSRSIERNIATRDLTAANSNRPDVDIPRLSLAPYLHKFIHQRRGIHLFFLLLPPGRTCAIHRGAARFEFQVSLRRRLASVGGREGRSGGTFDESFRVARLNQYMAGNGVVLTAYRPHIPARSCANRGWSGIISLV